ncbi:YdcF family protein [Spirulina sp. 06S082]|uniref:YdcF family protein n=1 Tax=Spirulina sp. 06S082 TaxID=3110248 RepID=UPI002B2033A8|nr:YdcF family protein [Spirulina sp. 06S082]MEA5471619.1 YdcF family protein [Spirulina sp. 06S082]
MFLFLSKFLPLFFYPLGLSCVLLGVSFVLSWQRSRWTPLPIAVAFLLIITTSHPSVNAFLIHSLEGRHIPSKELPQADAIVVLGGCIKPATPPRPMVDITEGGDRLLYAAQLYKQGKAPLIIVAGGRIGWGEKFPPESADMAQLLEFLGVPRSAIIEETESLNTYQNAVNVKKILEKEKLDRILLVTSAMHMARSYLIFKHQNIDFIPAPTDFYTTENLNIKTDFNLWVFLLSLIPSIEGMSNTTQALREYIGIVVYWLRGWL